MIQPIRNIQSTRFPNNGDVQQNNNITLRRTNRTLRSDDQPSILPFSSSPAKSETVSWRNEEQTLELVQRIQAGDRQAEKELSTDYSSFVKYHAGRYQFPNISEDLRQSGDEAVVLAARKFPWGGHTFKSYATLWIRKKMLEEISKTRPLFYPKEIRGDLRELNQFYTHYRSEHNDEPTDEQIAKALYPINKDEVIKEISDKEKKKVDLRNKQVQEKIKEIKVKNLNHVLLLKKCDKLTITQGGQGWLSDKKSVSPVKNAADHEQYEKLGFYLQQLHPRPRIAIILKFGLDGQGERFFKEIGAVLGVSRKRATDIYNAGFAKLQKLLCPAENSFS